jgi:PAS domain S-box-containing protein
LSGHTSLRPILLAAAPALLILGIGGASGLALRRTARTAATMRETEQALVAAERAYARVADALGDARSYALTGDSSALLDTIGRRAALLADFARMESLTRAEPTTGPRLRLFRAALLRQLDDADSLLALRTRAGRRTPTSPAMRALVRRTTLSVDSLRGHVEALEQRVHRTLTARARADAIVQDATLGALAGALLLAALAAAAVHLALTRLLNRARAQTEELTRGNARLREQGSELARRREQLEDQALRLELANEQLREQATELELQTAQLQDQTVELEMANEALRESALRDQLLFECAPVPMWMFDADTLAFLAVNAAAVERYGWTREQFLGMTIRDIRPPSDVPLVERYAREHHDGTTTRRAVRHVTRTGELLDVVVVAHDADLGGRRVRIVTAEDETARTAAERARDAAQRQLRQAQKMEAIGRMAGGVAHDFNNLLSVVRVNVEAIRDALPGDSPFHAELVEVGEAVDRATALTRQLLAVGRQQPVQLRAVDLSETVRRSGTLLRRLAGDRVRIAFQLTDVPLIVAADQGQLEQVLMNLAVNARDAMPAGGTLTIGTRRGTMHPPGGDMDTAQRWAVLSVEDTGVGMDAATRERIFEPFFTTKPPGAGTGLGLATAFGIVQQSGGHILVESAPGAGARFEVLLQLSDTPPAEAPLLPLERAVEWSPEWPPDTHPAAPPAPYAGPPTDARRRTPPRGAPALPVGPREAAAPLPPARPGDSTRR